MPRVSFLSMCVCYIIVIYTAFFFYPKWNKNGTEATISWDVSGYYLYLPALFIYKDIRQFSFRNKIIAQYKPSPDFQQAFLHQSSGNYVLKYSLGQSIAMLPFFLIAHGYCLWNTHFLADGFSYPYQIAIGIGMLSYTIVGIYFLRKILLLYFKDEIVAFVLLGLVIGSNYLNYSAIEQAMTHSILFTLYCCILYFTIQLHHTYDTKYFVYLGLSIGWAILIRPSEIVALFIPLFWDIKSVSDVKRKLSILKVQRNNILITGLTICLLLSIQVLYWKWVANEWLVYSYEKQSFRFLSPYIVDFCFNYRSGWIMHTPIMLIPVIGCIIYFFKGIQQGAVLSFLFLNAYIVMSWDIWDYGGFSGRAMVQSYPVLAFPFCFIVDKLFVHKMTKWIGIGVLSCFIYFNIWWTYHLHAGDLQLSGATKEYYWKVLGNWSYREEDKKLLDNPTVFYDKPQNISVLYYNDFSNDSSLNLITVQSNPKLRLNQDLSSTLEYSIDRTPAFKKWIRVSADIYCVSKEWETWNQTQFILKFTRRCKAVQTNFIRIQRFISEGSTKNIYLDAIIPNEDWDTLTLSFWNAGSSKEIYIDNVNVITFNY